MYVVRRSRKWLRPHEPIKGLQTEWSTDLKYLCSVRVGRWMCGSLLYAANVRPNFWSTVARSHPWQRLLRNCEKLLSMEGKNRCLRSETSNERTKVLNFSSSHQKTGSANADGLKSPGSALARTSFGRVDVDKVLLKTKTMELFRRPSVVTL